MINNPNYAVDSSDSLLKKLFIRLTLAFILFAVCGGGWYYISYQKSPEYSLKLIQTAISKNDLTTFEKHVDIDKLSIQIVKGYISVQNKEINIDKKNHPIIQFMEDYATTIYPNDLKILFRNYISDPDFNVDLIDEKSKNIIDDVNENTNFMYSKIVGILKIDEIDKIANVHLLVHDNKTNTNRTLILKMQKISNDFWKITYFVNLDNYMLNIKKAK